MAIGYDMREVMCLRETTEKLEEAFRLLNKAEILYQRAKEERTPEYITQMFAEARRDLGIVRETINSETMIKAHNLNVMLDRLEKENGNQN